MKKEHRKHRASFKTEVVFSTLRGVEGLSELFYRYGVSQQQISNWKSVFLSRCIEIFSSKSPSDTLEKEQKSLYEKINRLEVEIVFCKRASEWLGILKSVKR